MIIRAYDGLPRTYAPDIGEVVEARRTVAEGFVRAVVLDVRRTRGGGLRVKVQWLGNDPLAGVTVRAPIEAGTVGWVVTKPDMSGSPLIMQIDRDPGQD
jgi:C-terminal processing protease CtpA/Prc